MRWRSTALLALLLVAWRDDRASADLDCKPSCDCTNDFLPLCASNGITFVNHCYFSCFKSQCQGLKDIVPFSRGRCIVM